MSDSAFGYQVYDDLNVEQLESCLQKPLIAIDTELHGLRLHRDQICLVQIGDDARNVTLVQPRQGKFPENLKTLLEEPRVRKIFHYALTDVAFFETSLGIQVQNFRCTKVMSKLIRTYTDSHGLKHLCDELLGIDISKQQQQTNWASLHLTQAQLQYAASDVFYLIEIYEKLTAMMEARPDLPSGRKILDLNEAAQRMLPSLVYLLIDGYGDRDQGWETGLFAH